MLNSEYNFGSVTQIPAGEGRQFRAGDKNIAIFHDRSGRIYASEPLCPHLGGPLADGLVGGGKIICPLHERIFDLNSGECMSCEGSIQTYPVRLTNTGEMMITI